MKNKYQTPKFLLKPKFEFREDELREIDYKPNGEDFSYFNLGYGNRRILFSPDYDSKIFYRKSTSKLKGNRKNKNE